MTAGQVCLQCGTVSSAAVAVVCRRCGLRFGAPPRETAVLPSCPVCYATVGDDGRLPSFRSALQRIDLVAHMAEHDDFPPGDDDYLETLRAGDRIVIGRWTAPFDVVRRYLVTGVVDAGRNRTMQHNAVISAMAQVARWGPDARILGDQEEWIAARRAISELMERYHRTRRSPALTR